MTELIQAVEKAFERDGDLAAADPAFLVRQGQTDMALAVASCIQSGGQLVVEAGTGVGKTYAYLVPALLSGERVLLSTATKTLQDQLFGRDIPRLLEALGVTARVALLKGRASYYCPQRAETAHHFVESGQRQVLATLGKIEQWARLTRSGDLAEVAGLDERSAAIPLVTSTKDNCLGSECPKFKACYVNFARKEAMAADLVVVNHHLFFADLAVRESGMAELLPTCRVVVFDEAHKLNEIGVEFSGFQIGSRQLLDFCREVLATVLAKARGMAPWGELVLAVEAATRDLRLMLGSHGGASARISWEQGWPEGVDPVQWAAAIGQLHSALVELESALEVTAPMAPEIHKMQTRCHDLVAGVSRFMGGCALDHVRWVELGPQFRLKEAPLDISALLSAQRQPNPIAVPTDDFLSDWQAHQEEVDKDAFPTEAPAYSPTTTLGKSWIYTSATLGDDARLSWFTEPCGLQDARVLTVKSPFDYAAQAGLYVPSQFPKPSDANHSAAVATFAAQYARVLGGRTMVLTTTLKALSVIGDALQEQLGQDGDLQILRQGATTKRELIERFRAGANSGQRGCILVASASFWEGVDIPGDALQLVVIDKLPFPPPHDPLVKARCQRLEGLGQNAFQDYFIPEAVVALKQGAGRLIRHENDVGVLAVCDTRLQAMGYGRRVLSALPPMQRLREVAALEDYLAMLTRISTTHS